MEGVRGDTTVTRGSTWFLCRCFEVTLARFQVQIGAQGTDDDVRVKVR